MPSECLLQAERAVKQGHRERMKEQKTKHEEAAAVAAATRQEASERDAKTHADQDRSNEAAMAAAAASQQLAAAQRKATVTLTSKVKQHLQHSDGLCSWQQKWRRWKPSKNAGQSELRKSRRLKRELRNNSRGKPETVGEERDASCYHCAVLLNRNAAILQRNIKQR